MSGVRRKRWHGLSKGWVRPGRKLLPADHYQGRQPWFEARNNLKGEAALEEAVWAEFRLEVGQMV